MEYPKYLPMGDRAFLVRFGDEISEELNKKVRALALLVEKERLPGVEELVPTYRSLMICYNPIKVSPKDLESVLRKLVQNIGDVRLPDPKVIEVPTVYGGRYGPDLEFVARYHGLKPEEVIELHANRDYLVYMLGFTPGFTFLGGLDERLHTPRLSTPRKKVPAGSVGIGGKQTGLYAVSSPGGWRLIGRTYLKIYDPKREPPIIVKAGDYMRFIPISEEEFLSKWQGPLEFAEPVEE
ncbi:MAG: 5-oxoprolinase subunit PxpB [Synergistetes bacterium]|nr:5-oxoprolinase subunit PxpB [Synergistota bacterium]MDW8192360.1 5-oxoprolinase subunit PxpB [Synergistota bacterium]